MSVELEVLLRRAGAELPQPAEAATERARTAALAACSPACAVPRGRLRRVSVLLAAALALLAVGGAALAVGTDVFDRFDLRGGPSDPRRLGERYRVASVGDFSLDAWNSTRGICLGVAVDGEPAASGCGMPVVGAPPDQVVAQPPPTHVIGYMAGGTDGWPLWIAGPIAAGVERVEVEIVDGRTFDAPTYSAPAELAGSVNFYVLVLEEYSPSEFRTHPVRAVRAYARDGSLLEELVLSR
jgi:hypothetical protein